MKKTFRIKRETEFQYVFKKGSSCANRMFVVYSIPNNAYKHFRVGISVGKKVGNAVTRNAVKRKIRQSLLELKPEISNIDFIVIARPGVDKLDMESFKKNLVHALKLNGVLIEDKAREND